MQTNAQSPTGQRLTAARIVQKYGIVIALLLACLVLSFLSSNFLTGRNMLNVLRQTSINGVLAIGMTFVILTRGIDLSVGSVVALTGVVAASFATTMSGLVVKPQRANASTTPNWVSAGRSEASPQA